MVVGLIDSMEYFYGLYYICNKLNIINKPFIGMVIVVNLPMVMPVSRRPEIEDPMTASVANAAVAGP